MRREIAAGKLTVARALADPRAQSMTVLMLLTAQYRWGRARALPVCRRMRVSENRRLSDLTDRQRAQLVEILEG